MRRGEVRWYRFARPDKRRPVFLLSRDSVIGYLGEVEHQAALATQNAKHFRHVEGLRLIPY
jgi:hypothetical protein